MRKLNQQQFDAEFSGAAKYMAQAFELAARVISASPNPRVGCVLVKDDQVVGKGWHAAAGEPHAEVVAMQKAGKQCHGATAFVTLEPCSHHGRTPPCADALIKAGVERVVIAAIDPSPQVSGEGAARLADAGVDVIRLTGFKEQAERLNPGWLSRQRRGKPYVRCKLAMSLDGRTALANGVSKWITSAAARADVQLLRAGCDAIVTGIGTILADNPSLNVRVEEAQEEHRDKIAARLADVGQPLRVIVDSKLQTPADAKLFDGEGEVRIYTTRSAVNNSLNKNAEITPVAEKQGRVHLESMLESLTSSFGCNELLVEAGPALSTAFLDAGLIDELIIYIAPRFLGQDARSLLALSGLQTLNEATELEFDDVCRIGKDIRITAKPIR